VGNYSIVFTAGVSFLITLLLLPHLAGMASRIGLVDLPTRRKVHQTPKPLVGGIGIVAGLSIASLLFIPLTSLKGFYAGLLILMISGFLDDYRELQPRLKFIFQITAALLMIYLSDNVLHTFGDLFSFGEINLGAMAIPATVFCTVGVINAINMIDGLDGLAGGLSFISLLAFSVLASLNGQRELMLVSICLAAAVMAFLKYNFSPASLFMGDAGSLSLGFALGYLSIALTQWEGSRVSPVVPLLVLSVPLVDTVTIMTRRLMKGRSPFEADRFHTHHILIRLGLSREAAVKVLLAISLTMALIGIAGVVAEIPDHKLFSVFALYFLLCFISSFYIKETFMLKARFRRRRRCVGMFLNSLLVAVVKILIKLHILDRAERYNVNLRLECVDQSSRSFEGEVLNISKGGLCAQMDGLIFPGNTLEVDIALPLPNNEKRFKAVAEVGWLRREYNGYRYGMKFRNLSSRQQRILSEFIEALKEEAEPLACLPTQQTR